MLKNKNKLSVEKQKKNKKRFFFNLICLFRHNHHLYIREQVRNKLF